MREKGHYNQVKMRDLQGRQVKYIQRDHEHGGFFLLSFEPFDSFITVKHTNWMIENIRFSQNIEPNIIQIFDFNLQDALE
jgi:plasmid replication initiation protein